MALPSNFERKVLTAFTAAILVVAALSASVWKLSQDASDAADWVARSQEMILRLTQVKADTLQIQLSTQAFRVSGNTTWLAERDASIADREAHLQRLQKLTADFPQQNLRWSQLREVINQRIEISIRVELLRKTEGSAAADAFVATAPLQETRDRTNQLLREMRTEEIQRLEGRITEQAKARQVLSIVGTLAAALLGILLFATYILLKRQLRETRASQQALVESEESLSATLLSIGDAVMATDTEGRITRMNSVAERLTGWPFSEAQGRPIGEVFQIINEVTREPAEIPVIAVLETGVVQGLANNTALIARDGTELPIADSAAPIRNYADEICGVVLVFRDVTIEQQAKRIVQEQNDILEQRVQERTQELRDSQEHLRSVISNVPALIAYVDAQQNYVYVNDQYRMRFAPFLDDITGHSVREILGNERYSIAGPLINKVLQGEQQSYDWQPFPRVWQVINYVPRRDKQQNVVGYYVLGTDITTRKLAEEKVLSLNAELAHHLSDLQHVTRALKTLSAGNRTMLRATDEQQLLHEMCRVIVEEGGYDTAIVWYRNDDSVKSLRPIAEYGYPTGIAGLAGINASWGDNEYGQGAVAMSIRTGKTKVVPDIRANQAYQHWRDELHGYASSISCPLFVSNEVVGTLAIYDAEPNAFEQDEVELLTDSAEDLAFGIALLRARNEKQKIQEEVRHLANYDALTGLPNEVQFTELLTTAIKHAKHLGQSLAVMQINIERLREINDTLGFQQGDLLLKEFGARLRGAMSATQIAARLRGDEFAVLLPRAVVNDAITMVEHIESSLTPPFLIADIPLNISTTTGITLFPEHGATPHDLYRHMDIAMHQAKREGVTHLVFNPVKSQTKTHQLTLASELRRAIENGDLQLYLQPKIEILSGEICGAEGLVRWQHKTRGMIMPNEFISLAERTGLINPLTEWVIETALRLNFAWLQEAKTLPIAVNLSARNLRDEKLLQKIRQLLTSLNLPRGLLEIEITESSVMEDAEFSLGILQRFCDEEIPLYVDDFGTGYSSLSYLQKLPIQYIKIDQSFVRKITTDKDSFSIVRSTIDLVHDLGRKAVAEGVETREDFELLAKLGCDIAQGYFIARPMPSEDLQNWCSNYRKSNFDWKTWN